MVKSGNPETPPPRAGGSTCRRCPRRATAPPPVRCCPCTRRASAGGSQEEAGLHECFSNSGLEKDMGRLQWRIERVAVHESYAWSMPDLRFDVRRTERWWCTIFGCVVSLGILDIFPHLQCEYARPDDDRIRRIPSQACSQSKGSQKNLRGGVQGASGLLISTQRLATRL